MNYKKILITGGAGFIGSYIAKGLKKIYPTIEIIALDNLYRRGSEYNIPLLKKAGVKYIYGDVRNTADLSFTFDLLIECSAEPSVMAGLNSSPDYMLQANLTGAINCIGQARKNRSDIIFLSTSRVYPWKTINKLNFIEEKTRYSLATSQKINGVSKKGINEDFSLSGTRSLYGATKLAAELLLSEYNEAYNMKIIVNRFGTVAGPGQFGKADQGIIMYWLISHLLDKPLSYIGFGGQGKQVRDILHVDDLFRALVLQIKDMDIYSGQTFNIGGGIKNSVSLVELTTLCQELTGKKMEISAIKEDRYWDVKSYISDYSSFASLNKWRPEKNVNDVINDILLWLNENEDMLTFFENNLLK